MCCVKYRPQHHTHLSLRHGEDFVTEDDRVQPVSDGQGGALSKNAPDGSLDEHVSLRGFSGKGTQNSLRHRAFRKLSKFNN